MNKNKNYLELYLNKFSVDICILSEIFNADENASSSYVNNYGLFCKKRIDNYGGVAILHKKTIKMKKLPFASNLDILICQTTNLSQNLTIVSVYFPHSVKSNVLKTEVSKLLIFLNGKSNVIIGGDFNARCKAYGDVFDTVRGSTVQTLMDSSAFRCVNDGSATFKKNLFDNSFGSVLDLTFTNMSSNFNWNVKNTSIGGSHHRPILINIDNFTSKQQYFLAKKHLFKNLSNLKIDSNMNDIQSKLKSTIKNSTFLITAETKFQTWWNNDITILLRQKEAAEQKFDRYKTTENALSAINAISKFKKAVKCAKNRDKRRKLSDLSQLSNSKSLFRYVKSCKSVFEPQFASKWNTDNNEAFLRHLSEQVPNNRQTISISIYNNQSANFSMEELDNVLQQKTKPSAAGLDGITYEMVNKLSQDSKQHLLNSFNNQWKNCEFFEEWRRIKIVPIPKKGKNLDICTNFRPIALISVLAKILNLMVKQRLNDFLDEHKTLPPRSYAYRKHVSTSTCINDILHTINTSKEKNDKVIVLSMDVSKAYECVDINYLKMILIEINIPLQIRLWIINFLCKRTLCMGNSTLNIYNGIPQGSCLSPTLFNLYTIGLHGLADENTNIFQYADDFILLVASHDFDSANNILQIKTNNMVSLLKKLNLDVNVEKTSVMYVAKGGRRNPNILLNGVQVNVVKSIKFLGRHIKNSLSLKEHYEEVMISCRNTVNALKMVTGPKSGIHPAKAINLSKSLIFSKTEYAISSMAHRPMYINKKLTSFQNQLLRKYLGLVPSTPNHVVYALAGMLPTDLRAQHLAAKELIRLKIYNSSLYEYFTSNISRKTSLGYVYTKFRTIFENLKIGYNQHPTNKVDFMLDIFNTTKNNTPTEYFKAHYYELINDFRSEGVSIWATDAAVFNNNTGCAVCNISANQNFVFKINEKLSSLTGELCAIEKAIDLMIEDGVSTAALFTDSKNACLLLKNNTSHNFTVYNILNKIVNSHLIKISFVWTPSHVGIPINETADYFAKHAANVGSPINFCLSVTDASKRIESLLWNEFIENYKDISRTKGTYFYQFFPAPAKQPWFFSSNMKPENIKIVNRLLTGHTYTKKYFHRIGIADSNLCETCNEIEDEKHIIFFCKKHQNHRNDFDLFKKFNNLPEILMSKNQQNIDELINFIALCKIEV